jgi:hypothetical protein
MERNVALCITFHLIPNSHVDRKILENSLKALNLPVMRRGLLPIRELYRKNCMIPNRAATSSRE